MAIYFGVDWLSIETPKALAPRYLS